MKHAYLIMAHSDFQLLKILINLLDDGRNDIFLHIDKKIKQQVFDFSTKFSNLHILNERKKVYWGHSSQIATELLLFETAFRNGPYQYYHLLSGADLPIKSQDYIHRFFDKWQGKEFVGFWHDLDWQADYRMSEYFPFMQYERGYNRYINVFFSKLRRIIRRFITALSGKRPKELQWKKGPNWVSITHAFCDYLILKKSWILKRFRYTENGDEIFLQSILWNSYFRDNLYDAGDVDNGCMREIDWKRGTSTSPYVWRIEDIELLKASDKLFARKFSLQTDTTIINKITTVW